jgi:hypothetical protein
MRVLPLKWQRAVEALFLTEGDRTQALRLAGYEGKPTSLNVMASRIFGDERVRRAIKEQCNARIDTSEVETMAIVRHIMRNTSEKAADRLRAASMIWDRANPVMNRLKVEVEHSLSDAERDIQHYYGLKKLGAPQDAFIARFGPNGLARVEAMVLAEEAKRRQIENGSTTIDAEYEDVTPDEPDEPTPAGEPDDTAAAFDEDLL